MSNIANKLICLKLNKAWQPVGHSTVGKALVDLAAGISARALDLGYELDENGEPIGDPIYMNPVDWDTWLTLPCRPYDLVIHTSKMAVRVPTVLIAKNFNKMPMKKFKGKPSKDAIWIRDDGVDQYTGKRLRREDATIDHVVPQSKGGHDSWENLVTTHRDINSGKGNKSNSEAGLELIRPAKAPLPIPISLLIREVKHRDWRPFLVKIDK
jgi:hypothetical protein